ncbi:hypothetical protein Golob_012221 [Gossypium lobatum]|uniref:RNase H type-1 domain-containing protein n=1 Tax=Gossypium lobatum TaxID=34289 RepID=A0A7J8MRX8_9ROSI|nr:hypothetical protein [Gossypium lobatum]
MKADSPSSAEAFVLSLQKIEAQVVLEGLQLAWEKSFREVEVESDDKNFRHIQRGNNKVADCLAKAVEGDLDRLMVLEELPISVPEFLGEGINLSLLAVN